MKSGQSGSGTRAYRPEIDGLRAIAVSSVILYHAGFNSATGGFVGVDVFFVISGFLITGILYSEISNGRFSIGRFYERRARRILPALSFVLATSIATALFLLGPEQLATFCKSLVAVVAFISNHYFLLNTGYFSPDAHDIPLLHTWTLSVEEQFYLVMPVGMLIAIRYRPQSLQLILWIAMLLSFLLSVRFETTAPLANFFIAPTRAWEFMVGSLLAVDLESRGHRYHVRSWVSQLSSLVGLGCLGWSIFAYHDGISFPGFSALLPVTGSALIIAFAVPGTFAARALSIKPMVWIGLVSYSAYLWHQPVLAFYRQAMGQAAGPIETILLIGLIVGLSYLSWRFVESPFRDRNRVSTRGVVLLTVLSTAAFALFGVAGNVAQGFPGRFSPQQNALVATAMKSPRREDCHNTADTGPQPRYACRYFGSPVNWAVLGDSHGIEISYALAEALRLDGQGGILHLSKSGCQPALEFASDVPGCHEWAIAALDTLAREPGIRNVVVVYRHTYYLFGSQMLSYPRLPADRPHFLLDKNADVARRAYWHSFTGILSQLHNMGKKVYVLDPVPELGRSVEWYVYRGLRRDSMAQRMLGPNLDYYRARHNFVLSEMNTLPYDSSLVRVKTSEALCTLNNCFAGDGRQLFYFDDNHLSVYGAKLVVDRMLDTGAARIDHR